MALGAVALALLAAGGAWLAPRFMKPGEPAAVAVPAASSAASVESSTALLAGLESLLADHRQIIVLLADQDQLAAADLQSAIVVGQKLFHHKVEGEARLSADIDRMIGAQARGREALVAALDYMESAPDLFDADRLAFLEILSNARDSLLKDSSLEAIKLHKRISEDLIALAEIEQRYERELGRILDRVGSRAITPKRERWEDYVAHLKTRYSRAQILKEQGLIVPYAMSSKDDGDGEIFGYRLPKKTVALTFDDGPHPRYTEEVAAILKQYGVPAVFFAVGRNIGSVDAAGKVSLGKNAKIGKALLDAGYAVGNHSYSHAELSKDTGDALRKEINDTDLILRSMDSRRAPLFRFPYGAHSSEALQLLNAEQLRSVMWSVDSLDWADPVPSSIADRVLRSVEADGRGIILFHDIHERTVKALPLVLERLVASGYRFAGWQDGDFAVQGEPAPVSKQPVSAGYGDSWAVVIGINDYARWPKLEYAVNDARAMQKTLVENFGFAPERVVLLQDAKATRNGILAAFHDQAAAGGVKPNDRVFVFFAGHGATRKLSSGREIGYIIPADADPANTAADAIPMTEIQNIAESLSARHVLFVMDACYSGLGLTRGGSGGFLRDNARRVGRQMLTAGGAEQMVADGGPGGHSIFTWTLLQALSGKGDLNGDGFMTATEIAAYVAPAVAGVSDQTPAFGSLPGSQGGDFVFELPATEEFLNADSTQLGRDAIELNGKLDHAAPTLVATAAGKAATATVIVKDLQGKDQKLIAVAAPAGSLRQQAQRANDRGLQLYREQRYAEAEAEFTEALKLRPSFALAANNLGFVYYKQQRYAESARWFENTLKLDPSRAVAYLNLGDARLNAGERAAALQAYRTYLDLLPKGAAAERVQQVLAGK